MLMEEYLAKQGVQMIVQPVYSPDLVPADFYSLLKLKKELIGATMIPEEFKKE
jgi:hypothetical protein